MRIQHNIMAMNAYRNYNTNTSALSKNLEKLSSGYKINRAGDDAAGLAISEKMRAQITGLNAAQKNVKDGISLVKTAEGAMQEIQDMLNRMDYLATQSANGTYDDPVDRMNLQKEVNQLRSEINRIADSANFNGIKLLDGSLSTGNANAWNVTPEVIQGQAAAPKWETQTISTKFGATTDGAQWHPGTGNGEQTEVSFKIDLAGMKATISGGAGATQTFTLKVGGEDVKFTVANSAAGEHTVTGNGLATAFKNANATVEIKGISFTVGGSGSELTFTLANNETYSKAEADTINGSWSEHVTLTKTAAGTDTATASTVETNIGTRHTAYDYVEAHADDGSGRAGIDLDLTGLVTDGSKLTIKGTSADGTGDVTFIFKTDANSAAAVTSSANEILIDVSDAKFDTEEKKVAEALRQMTHSDVNDKLDDPDAAGKEVYLSAHNGKLHLDQTTSSTAVYGRPEDMQKLVTFQKCSDSAAQAGSVSVDLNKFQEGNRVTVGDETYTVASATDAANNQYTAEDLVAKLKDQITKDIGSDYTVTVDGTKITAKATVPGTGDSPDDLKALKDKMTANITELKDANSKGRGLTLQIGDTSDSFNQLGVNVGDMHVYAMGTFSTETVDGKEVQVLGDSIDDIDISTLGGAQKAVDVIKNAINYVSSIRGDLGATQNRLEHTANNLSVMAENIQDAESTIRDTDVAEEMMAYTKNNILVQSAQAMLAQANAVPQGVLQLLG